MASQAERNRVLSITMKIVDAMSKPINIGIAVLRRLEKVAVTVFRVMTAPVRAFGKVLSGLLSPIGLVRSALAFLAARGIFRLVTATAEMGDQLLMMSQRLGVTVRDLSILRHAGQQVDVEMESLGNAFKFLARNSEEASRGVGESKSMFERLGVSVTDAGGRLREPMSIFEDVADRFSAMEDGGLKVSAAMKIFGRSGTEVIPLLNEGSEGIRRYTDDAERLGLIFTRLEAQQSDAFGDSLARLKGAFVGLRNVVALQVMPTLTDLFNKSANWVADNRATLKVWAAEAVAAFQFIARSAGSMMRLIANLAADPSSARALGQTFESLGLFIVGSMREGFVAGFRVFGNILQIMARPLIESGRVIGEEIGEAVRKGMLSPFARGDAQIVADAKARIAEYQKIVRQLIEGTVPAGLDYGDPNKAIPDFIRSINASRVEMADALARMEQPIITAQERIGLAFQDVITGIRTDTGNIADSIREGRDAIGKEFDQMIQRVEHAGEELVFAGTFFTRSGIPFFEIKKNEHVEQFIAQIERLKTEYIAARDAARSMNQEVAATQPERAGAGVFEEQFDDDAKDNIRRRQLEFFAMMATGRQRAIREENADYSEATAALAEELEQRKIDQATYYMGVEALALEHDRRLRELNGSFVDGAAAEFERWRDEVTDQFKNGADAVRDIVQGMSTGFENVFSSIIDGTKSAKDAWKDFGREVLNIIGKIIAKQIALQVVGAFFPGFGAAKGAAIYGGNIRYMAKGGVLNSPTVFRSNDGPVVAGEAGDEAFLPLRRDWRTGELAVRSVGGGGRDRGGDKFQITFNFPDILDAAGADRVLTKHSKTIEGIIERAIIQRRSMKEAIRAA